MNIHFTTVASGPHPGLDRLQRSADYYGIELNILGFGQPYPGNGAKVLWLAEFAATLPADHIVVYTDAFDSVFLASPEEFEKALQPVTSDLVFSAEQNFHMKGHPLFYLWQNLPIYRRYPNSPTRYRFINAGSFIGRAGRLVRLPTECGIAIDTPSDQTIFTRYFVSNPGAFELDYSHNLMTCNGGRIGFEATDYVWQDGRLKNRISQSYPCLLHVPGKNELSLQKLAEQSPFGGGEQPTLEDKKTYRRRQLLHRLIVSTTGDNFRFKFLAWNLGIIWTLIWLFSSIL